MAKIISRGCEVADVRQSDAAIHSALFGAASFRLLINALTGRGRQNFERQHRALVDLLGELEDLEREIINIDRSERATRGADELQTVLLSYIRALFKVIAGLAGICGQLEYDEQAYRDVNASGSSRFNRDKVQYEYALHELERWGSRLNRLFSSY